MEWTIHAIDTSTTQFSQPFPSRNPSLSPISVPSTQDATPTAQDTTPRDTATARDVTPTAHDTTARDAATARDATTA